MSRKGPSPQCLWEQIFLTVSHLHASPQASRIPLSSFVTILSIFFRVAAIRKNMKHGKIWRLYLGRPPGRAQKEETWHHMGWSVRWHWVRPTPRDSTHLLLDSNRYYHQGMWQHLSLDALLPSTGLKPKMSTQEWVLLVSSVLWVLVSRSTQTGGRL